ncbi:MAG: WD40 repeat domain-containing protein [Elainellaceae cyanobacterium]
MRRRVKFIASATSIAAFLLSFPQVNAQDDQAIAEALNSALETCTPSTHRIPSLPAAFGIDLINRVNIRGYEGENCIVDYTFATPQEPDVEASYLLCAYPPEAIERLLAMSEAAQSRDRSEDSSTSDRISITIDGEDASSDDENASVDVFESCEDNETWFEELDMQTGTLPPSEQGEPESPTIRDVQGDTQPATPLEIARIDHNDLYDLRFSPDSRYLVMLSREGAALWEIEANQERQRITLEPWRSSRHFSFSPNGRYLAAASDDETVQVWDIEANQEVARFAHGWEIYDVQFSPDSLYLATAGSDNAARVWNIETNQEVVHFTHGEYMNSARFSPDGRYLATTSENATARVWDIETAQEVARFGNETVLMRDARFNPDGRHLAISANETIPQVWNIETGQAMVHFVHGDEESISRGWSFDVRFSPNGRYVMATVRNGGTAQVWDLEANREAARIAHEPYQAAARFSPNSRYLVTVSSDATAQVWDLEANQAVAHITHGEHVLDVRFGPNNRYVATAGIDQWPTYRASNTLETTARVLDIEANQEVARISYEDRVEDIRFSPDGRYLATYSTTDDQEEGIIQIGIIQIWDLESRQE